MAKKFFRKQLLFPLLILFIVGILIRLYKLSFQSYWSDEAITVMRILSSDFFYALKNGFGVGDPTLYEFILYFWVKLFGTNEFPVRAFSAIFSIFTLPLMYFTAKEFFDKKTAILSTLLLALSAYHIFYAQEARMYAFSWFFVMASTLFFIKSIKKGGKGNWLIYLITTVCALYAHYSSFLVLFIQNMFVFIFRKKYEIKLMRWMGIQLMIIIFFLPWAYTAVIPYLVVPAFVKKDLYLFIIRPTYKTILETFAYYLCGHDWMVGGYGNKYFFFCKIILFLFGAVVFLSSWFNLMKEKSSDMKRAVVFMLLWCFLPILILYSTSVLIKPCYQVKYVGFALFPLYILIAFSLAKIRPKFLSIIALIIFLILNAFALYQYYNFPAKGEAKTITQYIKSKKATPVNILVYDIIESTSAFVYYCPSTYRINFIHQNCIREIIKNNESFWLIMPLRGESAYETLKNNGAEEGFTNIYYASERVKFKTRRAIFFRRKN